MRYLSLIVAVVMLNVICSTDDKAVKKKFTSARNNEKNRSRNFVAHRANQFSLNFFQKFSDLAPGTAVFAPYEYFISVSMTSYPLKNSLQKLNMKAYHLAGYSVNMSLGLQALVETIEGYKSFNFNSVRKIFHHIDFEPVAEFRAAVEKNTLSKPQLLDFDDPTEASEIINEWSKNTTQDRIFNVVEYDDIMPKVSLYHVNVICFKSSWFRPFTLVGDDDFYVNSTKRIKMPFMRQLHFFDHGKLPSINAEFIRIPYENNSSDDEISMFIILPNKVNGFAQLKKNIAAVKMAQLFRGQLREILLFVPKFKVESKFTITKSLANRLSCSTNVTDKRKHSKPYPTRRTVKFIQRVLFELDEKSGSKDINASATPGTPILKLNRPFIFIIATTRRNRVILFTGCYTGSQH